MVKVEKLSALMEQNEQVINETIYLVEEGQKHLKHLISNARMMVEIDEELQELFKQLKSNMEGR